MSDEHHSADDTAPRPMTADEERRRARRALADRARDAADLSLLMDMLDLDPCHDPPHEAARNHDPPYGNEAARGREPGRGHGAIRGSRHRARRRP
ncbi:hypothetical protein AB0I10_21650 [Streptomyces sp. NPDC050636]|uniref:hypothetical protein n=1 Tax=Streptomyces sp. NPDC050636 TaxID=3154510 RepID=UPI00343252AD